MSANDTPQARADFLAAVETFVQAAGMVSDAFVNTDAAVDAYPAYLPSFDEFEHDLMAWRDAIRDEPTPLTLAEAVDTLRFAHDALASLVMRTEPEYQPTAEERDNAQVVARMVARTLRRTGTYENPPRP